MKKGRFYRFRLYQPYSTKMAGVVGIEPTSMVLETTVLPLYYTPKADKPPYDYKLRAT